MDAEKHVTCTVDKFVVGVGSAVGKKSLDLPRECRLNGRDVIDSGQHSAFDSTGAIKHTADELLHFKFTAGESTAEQSTWVY